MCKIIYVEKEGRKVEGREERKKERFTPTSCLSRSPGRLKTVPIVKGCLRVSIGFTLLLTQLIRSPLRDGTRTSTDRNLPAYDT